MGDVSSLDWDALIEAAAAELHEPREHELFDESLFDECPVCHDSRARARIAVGAIRPTVEQAIRAAEQRGREQAAQAIERMAVAGTQEPPFGETVRMAVKLARGGSTDEQADLAYRMGRARDEDGGSIE